MPRLIDVAGRPRHLRGWKRQPTDPRDLKLQVSLFSALGLPAAMDLPRWVRIEDQGEVGSCTWNSSTSCAEYLVQKTGGPVVELSRLFGYYMTRVYLEHVPPGEDSGCFLRDVMKAWVKFGTCREATWPYVASNFSIEPSVEAKREALQSQLLLAATDGKPGYFAIPSITAMKRCLADGFPFVGGFEVPESMMAEETQKTGVVLMPKKGEGFVGGHAVAFVGYGYARHFRLPAKYEKLGLLLKFANSWSTRWGAKGFGYLPARYWNEGLFADLWTMRSVEGMKR